MRNERRNRFYQEPEDELTYEYNDADNENDSFDSFETEESDEVTDEILKETQRQQKAAGKKLLMMIQIVTCSIILAVALMLKLFGGNAYTTISQWFKKEFNATIVAQETVNTMQSAVKNVFSAKPNGQLSSSGTSSQPNTSSSAGTSSASSQTKGTSSGITSVPDGGNIYTNSLSTANNGLSITPVSLSVTLTEPVQNGTITSLFGEAREMANSQTKFHKGVDIAAPMGTNIACALPGTVELCAQNSSYGKYIIMNHGSGIKTLYAHCSSLIAKQGDTVSRGQTIALIGSTGDSTGPHVHLELLINGINYDPLPYFSRKSV